MENEQKLALEQEAPGIPALTLEGIDPPALTLEPEAPPVEEKKPEATTLDESALTPEEQKVVEEFSEKIDLQNSTMVLQYGSAAQKKIASFSDTALNNVRTKDLGEVGDQISHLVVELKGFDIDEEEKKAFSASLKTQATK